MCRPALTLAIPVTMGRLRAVKLATAPGVPRAAGPTAVSQAHHRAARVSSAVPSTTASGTVQGRAAAALISRATDSPSTIRTKSWNRSVRCAGLTATRLDGSSMVSAPAASQARAAPQKA